MDWIGLDFIITNIALTYNPDSHNYSLEIVDVENLNNYVSNNIV